MQKGMFTALRREGYERMEKWFNGYDDNGKVNWMSVHRYGKVMQ
jgi:hypothetical protein